MKEQVYQEKVPMKSRVVGGSLSEKDHPNQSPFQACVFDSESIILFDSLQFIRKANARHSRPGRGLLGLGHGRPGRLPLLLDRHW